MPEETTTYSLREMNTLFETVRRGISEPHRANNRHEFQEAVRALGQIYEQVGALRAEVDGMARAPFGEYQKMRERAERTEEQYENLIQAFAAEQRDRMALQEQHEALVRAAQEYLALKHLTILQLRERFGDDWTREVGDRSGKLAALARLESSKRPS